MSDDFAMSDDVAMSDALARLRPIAESAHFLGADVIVNWGLCSGRQAQ
jgi:hypothetical protein